MTYLTKILPVLIVPLIGIWVRKRELITKEGIESLKTVAVNICLPAVLLQAFINADYDLKAVLIPLFMFALCLLCWVIPRILFKKDAFLPFICSGFEAGMLGYSLFSMLFGQEHSSTFALVDLGQVLFVFTFYKIQLSKQNTQVKKQKIVKEMVSSPIIIAIVVGIILGTTRILNNEAQEVTQSILSFLSAPTSLLILICIGYDLRFKGLKVKQVFKALALRMGMLLILLIIIKLLLNAIYPNDQMLWYAFTLMFILPPPYVLPIFAKNEKESAYVCSTLTVSTLISLLCFVALSFIV